MFESSSEQALIGGLEEIRDRNLKKELSQIRAKIRIFHGVADVLVYPWLAKNQKSLIIGSILRWFLRSGPVTAFPSSKQRTLTRSLTRSRAKANRSLYAQRYPQAQNITAELRAFHG
jgi:hypothetical protein